MRQVFKYNWNLKDTLFKRDKGKVFSCFSGGGGSTMGYKFNNNNWGYVIGMSVPPVMIAQISNRIFEYWLSRL